jgi:hypothetical protein
MKSISIGKQFVCRMMVSLLILLTSSQVLSQLQEKKVVMVVPLKDFWDIELTTVKEIFEQNGLMVTIASSTLKEASVLVRSYWRLSFFHGLRQRRQRRLTLLVFLRTRPTGIRILPPRPLFFWHSLAQESAIPFWTA